MSKIKSDTITEIEEILNEQLKNICECTNEKDKEFFKSEYFRIQEIYLQEVKNWVAIL